MRKNYYLYFIFLSSLLVSSGCKNYEGDFSIKLPEEKPVSLTPYAEIKFEPINESSGLVKSHRWENIYWTHNDSGDEPRIFPINIDGRIVTPRWAEEWYAGITIADAENIDWEDIAIDCKGNLIIGAFGNNSNTRQDLAIYLVKEPHPYHTVSTRIYKKIMFRYPDQLKIPSEKMNFDAEALFCAQDRIYILTKHRSDSLTKLYRFDSMDPVELNTLTLLDSFNIRGMVTGADVTPDGNKLAVLTYYSLWLFEVTDGTDNYFGGKISWLPIRAKQCEGICFNNDRLIISNEQRELFDIPITALIHLKD